MTQTTIFDQLGEVDPAHAGMRQLHPLLDPSPQYDRHGNLRDPDAPDTTELDPSVNDGMWQHRDLFGHQLRWALIGRTIMGGERILDLGCGSTMPLANTINFGLGTYLPDLYVGVDYGKISRNVGKRAPRKWEGEHRSNFDATDRKQVEDLIELHGKFTLVTSFEVMEHIFPAESVVDYVANAYLALEPGGRFICSTPVVEVNSRGQRVRARNHVHEFGIDELRGIIESQGFVIEQRFGTFANYHDIKRALKEGGHADALAVYERCREFLTDNVLACMLAAAFPDHSRNNTWICRKPVDA
jgi:SAM-dependent methyltransferase